MTFTPINGQRVSDCAELRLGWCRVKTNGCAVVAIYNALGLLGCALPLGKILSYFHAWYRPHFFGISPRRIRAFFRKRGIETTRDKCHWEHGDVAIVTYWNRCFWKKFVNPFGGAHTVCVRFDGKFQVYNQYSKHTKTYCYDSLEALLRGRKAMQILAIAKKSL